MAVVPRGTRVRLAAAVGALVAAAVAPHAAHASALVASGVEHPTLAVSRDGVALVTYRKAGRVHRVLAWGAINARRPKEGAAQVAFKLDYSGGPKSRGFRDACRPYDGRWRVPWLVRGAACKAPDGSYWALQSWQRRLPNYGVTPTPRQAEFELHLSHWRGPPATLEIWLDWVFYGSLSYHHLFGRFTYRGFPVHGFRSESSGNPLDRWGRNLYLDTYGSPYGTGWHRENSFLAHRPNGNFCYGFFPRFGRGPGTGERYRITVIGPGVTPDVMWEAPALSAFDPASPADITRERAMNELSDRVSAGDPLCKRH